MQELRSDKPENDQSDRDVAGSIPASSKPQRIGGVLIFVAIGLVLSAIQSTTSFMSSLTLFLQAEIWQGLTVPGSTAYHPYWKSVLLFELASNAVILGLNGVALVLFFRKHRAFPKLIVLSIPFIFILILVGYYLSGLIPAVAESPEHEKGKAALIVRFIALHIWIPYFLVSQRVKKTFIR